MAKNTDIMFKLSLFSNLWSLYQLLTHILLPQTGLLRDDCLHETEDVKEALRRLPQNVVDERNFRMIRAMQLSLQKVILPKEEWTKFEEDKLYLSPIVEQVEKERLEREKWEKEY